MTFERIVLDNIWNIYMIMEKKNNIDNLKSSPWTEEELNLLKELYPTETFNNKSDVSIISNITELSEISNNYKIKW